MIRKDAEDLFKAQQRTILMQGLWNVKSESDTGNNRGNWENSSDNTWKVRNVVSTESGQFGHWTHVLRRMLV
jgi:hypothetical protein